MNTITLCVYNRPHYLQECLTALSKCIDIDDYHLQIFADNDGSKQCQEVQQLCKDFVFKSKDIQINNAKLGCNQNTKLALSWAYQNGSECHIHLEDDIIFSYDALVFMQKASILFNQIPLLRSISCFNDHTYTPYTKCLNWIISNIGEFHSWGWCTRREYIKELLDGWVVDGQRYLIDNRVCNIWSWDWIVRGLIWGDKYGIQAYIPRSKNIGRMGTWMRPNQWRETKIVSDYVDTYDLSVLNDLCVVR